MKYPVVEIFSSIQGEGAHTGRPANFIRLAGCSLACEWCDSKYSWDVSAFPLLSVEEIFARLNKKIRFVVITGGEPLLHDLLPLVTRLAEARWFVALETNGKHGLSSKLRSLIDWVTVSPKEQAGFAIEPAPNELKFIVDDSFSLEVLDKVSRQVPYSLIFLNPESARPEMMRKAYQMVMERPHCRLGVQLHKVFEVR